MFSRRTALQIGAISAVGLTESQLFAAGVKKNTEKAVIWIFLKGGCSFADTFNPSDSILDEYKSITGTIQTSIPGVNFSGGLERLAEKAKYLSIIKGFCHQNSDHSFASHLLQTGIENRQAGQSHPSIGSMVSKIYGGVSENGIPIYNTTSNLEFQNAAWLGSAYSPLDVNSDIKKNFLPTVELQRLKERTSVLAAIDNFQKDNQKIKDLNKLKNQAYNVILGEARESFEINKEPKELIEKYGTGFGQNLLIARRLVERGSKFVNVELSNFDLHSGLEDGHKRLNPILDNGISVLIEDLISRDMDKNVMVIITSEFSRTKIVLNPGSDTVGRNHNPQTCPLVIFGGEFNHGQVVGTTDDKCLSADTRKCGPPDLVATIFKHFGIRNNQQETNNQGRPIYLIDKGISIL